MELKGKKINFLGDSITEGCGTSGPEYGFPWLLKQKLGLAEARNYGIGGTRIAAQLECGGSGADRNYCDRALELDEDADVVVVFGGTNDFGHGDAAFGKFTDRTGDTFCGAFHLLLQKLINKYPAAKIVVMTPTHRLSEDEDVYNELGVRRMGKLVRYVDAEKEIAGFYGLPCVDLFRECPMQPKMEVMRQRFMPDGLHPNDAGNELIANCLLKVLREL